MGIRKFIAAAVLAGASIALASQANAAGDFALSIQKGATTHTDTCAGSVCNWSPAFATISSFNASQTGLPRAAFVLGSGDFASAGSVGSPVTVTLQVEYFGLSLSGAPNAAFNYVASLTNNSAGPVTNASITGATATLYNYNGTDTSVGSPAGVSFTSANGGPIIKTVAAGDYDVVMDLTIQETGAGHYHFSNAFSAVPEPASLALLGMGLLLVGGIFGWRRKQDSLSA